MPHIRPFTNLDPPAVTQIWQRCARHPGLALPVSVDSFERLVFSKLYFPLSCLFLAFEGNKPVGFAHAAFGPNAERTWISAEDGVVCMLVVCPDCPQRDAVARQLLDHCDRFLAESGAATIQGGAAPPRAPFYIGLYGGSMPPGILTTDQLAQDAFISAGYRIAGRTLIFRRSLATFRASLDRRSMQIRRSMQLDTRIDPPARDWWEAMELGDFDLTRFTLTERRVPKPVASLTVRDMGPPSPELPGPAAGILDLVVDEAHRRKGVATFLLSEAFRQLMHQGVCGVEAHVPADDTASAAFYRKLGFDMAAEGVQFRKEVAHFSHQSTGASPIDA